MNIDKLKIRPERILVEVDAGGMTPGGIYLPDNVSMGSYHATIIKIGSDCVDKGLEVGGLIIYSSLAHSPTIETYVSMHYGNILAKAIYGQDKFPVVPIEKYICLKQVRSGPERSSKGGIIVTDDHNRYLSSKCPFDKYEYVGAGPEVTLKKHRKGRCYLVDYTKHGTTIIVDDVAYLLTHEDYIVAEISKKAVII